MIRVLVMAACAMLGWGAWQQVVVGMVSHSVVLGYPVALLPLTALLCAVAIGVMALAELVRVGILSKWELYEDGQKVRWFR